MERTQRQNCNSKRIIDLKPNNLTSLFFFLQEWEQKANKDKERYAEEMKNFKGSTGEKSSPVKRKNDSPGTNKGGFKSKEYISDDDSSDSDSGTKKKVAKVSEKSDKKSKNSKKESSKDDEDDDNEEEESEAVSTGEDSD